MVVADNGSSDGSAELARRWADEHPGFHVVDASERRGPSAARNAGARAASGEMLAFCDADDVVQPGWLAACAAALAGADAVAGYFDFWSLNGGRPAPAQAASTRQLGFLPAALGANLAVRRHAFEAVDGFIEELLIGEDIDLCWRLQLQGFRFAEAFGAVVAKRERTRSSRQVFRQARTYGRCGPVLFRRYRATRGHGAIWHGGDEVMGVVARPHSRPLLRPGDAGITWARAAGMQAPGGSRARSPSGCSSPELEGDGSRSAHLTDQSAPTYTGERTITPSGSWYTRSGPNDLEGHDRAPGQERCPVCRLLG